MEVCERFQVGSIRWFEWDGVKIELCCQKHSVELVGFPRAPQVQDGFQLQKPIQYTTKISMMAALTMQGQLTAFVFGESPRLVQKILHCLADVLSNDWFRSLLQPMLPHKLL